MVNISYVKTNGNVVENYTKTLIGWENIDVDFKEIRTLIKDSSIQVSPFYYSTGCKSSDAWSNDKQNLLMLDFDDGYKLDEALELFKDNTYVIYTTKSHQIEKKGIKCDRFRVILEAINIPKGEMYWYMMRELETLLPIDKQVNTKTGAFLGNSNAITYSNIGKPYDCKFLHSMAEYRRANTIKARELSKQRKLDNLRDKVHTINVNDIKNYLDIDDTMDILEELSYEVDRTRKKFKLREDERTASCKIYPSGYIYDYGSGFKGDIIDVIQERLSINFIEAMKYAKQFIKR